MKWANVLNQHTEISVASSKLETEVKSNNNQEILGVERKIDDFNKNVDSESKRTHKQLFFKKVVEQDVHK